MLHVQVPPGGSALRVVATLLAFTPVDDLSGDARRLALRKVTTKAE